MGQILLEDKIGTLSHSSGVISLTASRLTIGGQQYNTSALNRTISDDVTLSGYNLYMVYAVVVGGIAVLRTSINYNSVGPSGFSAWKLVGCFHTLNGTFKEFLNINIPDSRIFTAQMTNTGATNQTINTTSTKITTIAPAYDTAGTWSAVNKDWTVPANGTYELAASVYASIPASGSVNVRIAIDGNTSGYSEGIAVNVSSVGSFSGATTPAIETRELLAGQKISMTSLSSPSSTTGGGFNPTYLNIRKIPGSNPIPIKDL